MKRGPAAALLALALSALCPAAGLAARLESLPRHALVTYFADPGERNRLVLYGYLTRPYPHQPVAHQIAHDAGAWTIRLRGGGCRRLRGLAVHCLTSNSWSVELGDGDDRLLVRRSPTFDLLRASGDDGDDVLTSRSTNLGISFYGGDGADVLTTRGAADELWGGNGDDELWAAGGEDQVKGEAGSDRMFGQGGRDFIYAAEGLDGPPGRDYVSGGGGIDWIDAVDGHPDVVRCGSERDTVAYDAGLDSVAADCERRYPRKPAAV